MAGPLPAHHRQHGPGHVHRSDQSGGQLVRDLLRGQVLEVAAVEVGGVVDQHVDAPEPVDRGLDGGCGVCRAGDVEPQHKQVLGFSDRFPHGLGVATGGDHRVPRGERRLGELHAHAATRTRDEPHPLLTHETSS